MVDRFEEHGVVFDCEGEGLLGIVAHPEGALRRGVLIVVGGPQYRAGSHRQFVLLARYLAESSVPNMRFDYRGMGDSTGAVRDFERIQADIRAAVDHFFQAVPEMEEVILWGLCDAASAAASYAATDSRVSGVVLLNPWVRTEAGQAKAVLKHYYLQRAMDLAFWKKAFSGNFDVKASLASFARNLGQAAHANRPPPPGPHANAHERESLPDRMRAALERFDGRILFILSGNDLTAKEFLDVVAADSRWSHLLADSRVERIDVREANHTFSSRAWRDLVAESTRAWILAGT